MSGDRRRWALVLGASSGFGEAAAKALAASGRSIFGVHMDRRAAMPHVEEVVAAIEATGAEAAFFNMNAADPDKRADALDAMKESMGEDGTLDVLLHSLAFGTLRPYTGDKAVSEAQMDMTVRVMAHSLVDWVQGAIERGMMGEGGRIFAMTSSGSNRVIPSYGPVSAAKAALESHIRQLAYELAPMGITANALRGGVTDTPALRKIPGNDQLIKAATARNPAGRLTTPEDVAGALVALAGPGTHWITGNVINVDGGEEITG
jgi:NAD(P)-dependent dehydrogenase (short-subunit alcohol dehydrogenase family)